MHPSVSSEQIKLLSRWLKRDGYLLLLMSLDTLPYFKDWKEERGIELNYTTRHLLKVFLKNDKREKVLQVPSGSIPARIIVASLYTFSVNDFREMDLEEFKEEVSDAFKKYCEKKELNEITSKDMKRLSVSSTIVGHQLKSRWFKKLFEYNEREDTIRLRYPLKEITLPEI